MRRILVAGTAGLAVAASVFAVPAVASAVAPRAAPASATPASLSAPPAAHEYVARAPAAKPGVPVIVEVINQAILTLGGIVAAGYIFVRGVKGRWL